MINSEKNYQLANCNLIKNMFQFEEKLSVEIVVNLGFQIWNQVKKPWWLPEHFCKGQTPLFLYTVRFIHRY